MRLSRIELDGVGPFDQAVFEIPESSRPGELVLFEGPNGSGKTTLLEMVAVLVGAADQSSRPLLFLMGEAEEARRRANRKGRANRLQETGSVLPRAVPRTLPPVADVQARRRGRATSGAVEIHGQDGSSLRTQISKASFSATGDPGLSAQVRAVEEGKAVHWAAFALRAPADSADLRTRGPQELKGDGLSGCLSFGAYGSNALELGQFLINNEFERVRAATYAREATTSVARGQMERAAEQRLEVTRRFERALSRTLGRKVDIEFPPGKLLPRVLFDGAEIPIEQLGEGLRRTVSWLSDLLVRLERTPWADPQRSPLEQDFWLLLDEVDEGLHPTLQMRLMPTLRDLFPNARIYATTHSPFVVASAESGWVFPIRPHDATHLVSGRQTPKALEPGRSLEWAVEEVFEARSMFIDRTSHEALQKHRDIIGALRKGEPVDIEVLRSVREQLLGMNEEVRTVVAMREAPVRGLVDQTLARGNP